MPTPDAVRKHDGRLVAFDLSRLSGSISRAACAADPTCTAQAARLLGQDFGAQAAAAILLPERPVPASADIRSTVLRVLRDAGMNPIADAYAEYARAAAGLLWRMRVIEPGTTPAAGAGAPWDRRRLMESLRASGVARDPAGEQARAVERRLVALGMERISPALIHSLAATILGERGMDVKAYQARRVAFSMTAQVPRFDPVSAEQFPLPPSGPWLEAFWVQSVHSQDVVRASRDNLISLEPVPNHVEAQPAGGLLAAQEPSQPSFAPSLRDWCVKPDQPLWVRADGPERIAELSRYLSILTPSLVPDSASGAAIDVVLRTYPLFLQKAPTDGRRALGSAHAITINLAGLVVREALRDPARATVRLSQTISLAAQAHREREEYFNLSPVRGRRLPIALAGLWNAVAWLQGESFENRHVSRASRALANTLVTVARGAVETLRSETGMELVLAGAAPQAAARQLWRADRDFFMRDGVNLDAAGSYDGGPAVKLVHGADDFTERIDFAKQVGNIFDEPPAVSIDVPLGSEPDITVWRDFLGACASAGVPRLHLISGGSVRTLKNLTRAVRSHLEGFPLFEQLGG